MPFAFRQKTTLSDPIKCKLKKRSKGLKKVPGHENPYGTRPERRGTFSLVSHSAKSGKGTDKTKSPEHMIQGLFPRLPARETGYADKRRELDRVDNSVS